MYPHRYWKVNETLEVEKVEMKRHSENMEFFKKELRFKRRDNDGMG